MPSTIHVFSDRFDASLSFQSNIPPGSEELIIRGTGTLSHGVPMACSIISFRCTFGQHVSCHWAGADGSLYYYSMRDDVAPSLPEWIHLRMTDVKEAKLFILIMSVGFENRSSYHRERGGTERGVSSPSVVNVSLSANSSFKTNMMSSIISFHLLF